ncbi:MAG: T9SS type A sorting domain-containing protein, partial [Bacteroidales bacterium]|nr:T9SS type A sorting domain-containing protein [Bacteroidales bacterium]
KNTMILTDVIFEEIEVICSTEKSISKNSNSIKLTYAGGYCNGQTVQVSDMPYLLIGGRYLIFTKDDGKVYANPIIGGNQGQFKIIKDEFDNKEYMLTAGGKVIWTIENFEIVISDKKVKYIHKSVVEFEPASTENAGLSSTLPFSSDGKGEATISDVSLDSKFENPITKSELANQIKSIKKDSSVDELKKENGGCFYYMKEDKIVSIKIPEIPQILPETDIQTRFIEYQKPNEDFILRGDNKGGSLGWCGYQDLSIVMQQVPTSWWDSPLYNNGMWDWNQIMGVYQYTSWDGGCGPNNGQSEFYSFWSDNTLYEFFGIHWGNSIAMCISWSEGNCGEIYETDIVFNQEKSWTDEPDIAINNGNVILLTPVLMHELGHSWGAQRPPAYPETYDYDVPTVMHSYYHNIYETGRGVHRGDAYMIRRNYDNQTYIKSTIDIGVESYYASNGLHKSTTNVSHYDTGDNMTINNITVENMSYSIVDNLKIRFYLSTNRNISTSDYKIGSTWVWETFPEESYYVGDFIQDIPSNIPSGSYYVGMIVTVNGFNNDDFTYNNTTCLSNAVVINNSIGILETGISNHFSLYPNPVKNELTVETSQFDIRDGIKILIYDLTGQIFLKRTILTEMTKIDLSRLSTGMYLVKIGTENDFITKKIIKK